MRAKTLMMLTLAILLVAVFASGQQLVVKVGAKIPFAFSVSGKVLPAGEYRFSEGPRAGSLTVRSSDGKEAAMALIQTRIAKEIHTSAGDAHVVFDKIGNSYFLSEVWVPGMDGFVLNVTKEAHEHMILNVPSE
jgi:hypothetical protein